MPVWIPKPGSWAWSAPIIPRCGIWWMNVIGCCHPFQTFPEKIIFLTGSSMYEDPAGHAEFFFFGDMVVSFQMEINW